MTTVGRKQASMPTALNLNLWSLIFCEPVFNCHVIFLYIHFSTLLISSFIASLLKSSMPLSSSLLSVDELNFIFTEKQDAITDHTQARSIASSHLVHLGIFAFPFFEAKCTICISYLGQHLHLWIKHHPSAIKDMIAVTVHLLRCIIVFLSVLCLSHHTHILLFSLIKSRQSNEKQKCSFIICSDYLSVFHSQQILSRVMSIFWLQSLSSCFLWIFTYLYFLFLLFCDNYSCLDLQLLFTAHINLVILDQHLWT